MSLPASGTISLGNVKTVFGISGNVAMSALSSWAGVPEGKLSLSDFRGKANVNTEYPPANVAVASAWTKDANDTFVGRNNVVYRKYKTTVVSPYGDGEYVAWANTIWAYVNGSTYASDEWGASGAFDKRVAVSYSNSGWHTANYEWFTKNADSDPPAMLWIKLPKAITLRQYSLETRNVLVQQAPTWWTLHGSTDGTNWTQIDKAEAVAWSYAGQVLTRTIPAADWKKFAYFRWSFTRNNDNSPGLLCLSEIRLHAPEYHAKSL